MPHQADGPAAITVPKSWYTFLKRIYRVMHFLACLYYDLCCWRAQLKQAWGYMDMVLGSVAQCCLPRS